MTTASQDKITVPGDDRLTKLNVSTKTPFWTKIPIIKELRVAVGWQKGMLITGLAITAFFLLVALFAPLIAPYGHAQIKAADGTSFPAQAAPSAEHIWGTTAAGFDVFSRVVWGARTAVIAIVVAVLLSIFAGVLLGLVSGYYGGWVDRILVMIADAVYSFPSLLLAILMAIMISHGQSGLWSGILASGISITVVYIPQYFRTIRAEVIRIKESAYVESARVVGASTWRIMTKHLFKNSTRTLPVILTLNSSEAILTLAGLGFLGFGIRHFCIVKSVVPGFMFAGIDIACQIFGNISVEHRAKDIVLEIPTVHSTTKFISDCPYRTVQLVPFLLFLCINHGFVLRNLSSDIVHFSLFP